MKMRTAIAQRNFCILEWEEYAREKLVLDKAVVFAIVLRNLYYNKKLALRRFSKPVLGDFICSGYLSFIGVVQISLPNGKDT